MDRTPPFCLLFVCLLGAPVMALAEEEASVPGLFDVSGNFALVSDYRFRGVSLSDEDFAPQGGFTLTTPSGLHLGTWASSIESFAGAEAEIDLVAGYAFTAATLDVDVGVTAFLFPGGSDVNYVEPYLSVGRSFGPLSAALGVAYAPDQENIGGTDSVYLFGDSAFAIAGTPISLTGHIGFEEGAFGDEKVDWSLGLSGTLFGLDLSAAYVDTNQAGTAADATVVLSVGVSF